MIRGDIVVGVVVVVVVVVCGDDDVVVVVDVIGGGLQLLVGRALLVELRTVVGAQSYFGVRGIYSANIFLAARPLKPYPQAQWPHFF